MKYKLLLITLFACGLGWGQVLATSSTSLNTTSSVSEQFANTSGVNAYTTGFPSSWSLSTATNQTSAPSSGSTAGGWYAGNDIGFLGSGSASNGNATWRLQNNTNSQIIGFSLSFKAKMYKSNTGTPSVKVYYSTNATGTIPSQGTTGFTEISSLTVGDASTFSNSVNTSGVTLSTSPSNNIAGLTLANANYLYIRFIFSGGTSSDLFSIDDVTITPIIAATSYTVTFDKNAVDASGSMTNQIASVASSLSSNLFSRSGFYFSRWNTLANGSGTSYTDGATYSFTSDVTLYAQWQTPTWNGNIWSNSIVPTSLLNAIIDGDLTTTTDLVCKDLTINSGKTLTIGAGNKLTVSGNLINNGTIVFKSSAIGTAMFDTFSGTLSGSGVTTVERFIPARRAYRFLSPAVTTSTTIRQNWQEDGGTVAGLGTHITGVDGITNGFDATSTNNPSLFTFNNSTGSWVAVTSTLLPNTLTAGTPYRLMVRGDRSIDMSTNSPSPTPTVLRATGTLHTGNFSPTLNQAAQGFSFVGNPYQAPLDIKTALQSSTDVNKNVVYYWDPTINDRGGYITRNLQTSLNIPNNTSVNDYVQPGQAFFVVNEPTLTGTPALTFTENHKSVANAAAGVFRNANTSEYGTLRVNLQANTNNQWQTIEGALAIFNDNFSWNVTSEDATKMANLDEDVSFVQNNTSLAIACQSNPSTTSELPLKIEKMRHSTYQWQFELDNYEGERAYLFDAVNNSYTEIIHGAVVPFTADANTTNRFKIVFQTSALSTDDFVKNIKLYPNPAKAGASFYLDGITEATVSVYNVVGQNIPVTVMSQGNAVQVTPKTALSQGVYLVTVTTAGKTAQVKWIVE